MLQSQQNSTNLADINVIDNIDSKYLPIYDYEFDADGGADSIDDQSDILPCSDEPGQDKYVLTIDPEYGPNPGDIYVAPPGTELYRDHVNYGSSSNPSWREVIIKSSGTLTLTDESEYFHEITYTGRNGIERHYTAYTQINGSDQDDIIWGIGRYNFKNADAWSHGDVIFGRDGHDWISGGYGDDTLSGGSGNDTILGGNDNDLLYGGTGDDLIEGGAGRDKLYGGIGNDVLKGGDADYLDGGSGNDWLFGAGSDSGGDTLKGGSGSDTFVIMDPDLPQDAPSPDGLETGGVDDTLWQIVGGIPKIGGIFKIIKGGLDLITQLKSTGNSTPEVSQHQAAKIVDFNPLHDTIMIEVSGSTNLTPSLEFGAYVDGGVAFRIKDGANGYLAEVRWDDLANWLDPAIDFTSGDALRHFQDHITETMVLIEKKDGKWIATNGKNQSVALDEEGAAQLSGGKYILLGGYEGVLRTGGDQVDYLFGTDHNDVLFGYGENGQSDAGVHADKLWGFGGDDFFDGGAGWNYIYGGADSDTSSYATASSGLNVNMNDTRTEGGRDYYIVRTTYENQNGDGGSATDYLFSVENIIGSDFADTIIGDQKANMLRGMDGDDSLVGGGGHDTLDSGMGDDTLEGNAGSDTFILSGGTNTIVDYKDGVDRIQISADEYGLPKNGLTLRVEPGADGWQITYNGEVIAVVQGDRPTGFDVLRKDADGKTVVEDYDLPDGLTLDDYLAAARLQGVTLSGSDEDWWGNSGQDIARATGFDNDLYGQQGNDILVVDGNGWRSKLDGHDGDDILINSSNAQVKSIQEMWGRNGDDVLVHWSDNGVSDMLGGAGADSFVFLSRVAEMGITTRIRDYASEDEIIIDLDAFEVSSIDEIEIVRTETHSEIHLGGGEWIEVHGDDVKRDDIKEYADDMLF